MKTKLVRGKNDLLTVYPEVAKEWDYEKNGTLKPENVTYGSNKKVWWLFPYDDPVTGKHFDFSWQDYIYNRTLHNCKCPYVFGHRLWKGYNDLATTHPHLAKEWDYVKNGHLIPTNVKANAKISVWWILPYDDPVTGKHFDFSWQTKVISRTDSSRPPVGCPYLSGRKVLQGFNDLATTHPHLAREWDYSKNGLLKPTDVTAGSNKKVWWKYEYVDLEKEQHITYSWKVDIKNRALNNNGCPFLSGFGYKAVTA